MEVDDFLATCRILTEAQIVDNVGGISEEEVAEEHTDVSKVTKKEEEKAAELLTYFLRGMLTMRASQLL